MTEYEQLQIEQLKKIADSLERIENNLNLFAGAVGYVPPRDTGYIKTGGYFFLRIGGSVGTD